jgi:glucosamine 6-phosphate synthetase-like amidotransferase/phosphosugar isomerase protein
MLRFCLVSQSLGYDLTHPIALERALKFNEITCARCEGISGSEFKHGPLSAVHDGYPVLFVTAPGDKMMMINHVKEVTTRGGWAIALAPSIRRFAPTSTTALSCPIRTASSH